MKIATKEQLLNLIGHQNYEFVKNLILLDKVHDVKVEKIKNYYKISGTATSYHYTHTFWFEMDDEGFPYRGFCHSYTCREDFCQHMAAAYLLVTYYDIKNFPVILDNEMVKREYRKECMNDPNFYQRVEDFHYQVLDKDFVDKMFRRKKSLQLLENTQSKLSILSLPINDEKMHLEVRLSATNHLTFRFAIGSNKMYIIKDLNQFLDDIDEQKTVKYGKDLIFEHRLDVFDEESREIITFLKRNIQPDVYRIKDICFTGYHLDNFVQLIQQYDEPHLNFECNIDDKAKIHMEAFEEDGLYRVRLSQAYHHEYITTTDKALYVSDGKHYLEGYIFDEEGICISLLKALLEDDLIFSYEEFQQFYESYIKPNLEFVNISMNFEMEETNIQLYLDLNEEYLIEAQVLYDNGNEQKVAYNMQETTFPSLQLILDTLSDICVFVNNEKELFYLDPKDNLTLAFLRHGLEKLKKYCEIMISESVMNITKPKSLSLSAGVRVDHQLLKVDVASIGFSKEEIYEVLNAYRRKKKYHRLKDGQVIDLEAGDISEVSELLDELNVPLKDLKKGKVSLPLYRSFQLQNLDNKAIQFQFDETYHTLLQKLEEPSSYNIAKRFESILRDYQKDGVRWLLQLYHYQLNGILADDMGLGKSLQVIALLESIVAKDTSLLVVPASLIYNWNDEFQKFQSPLSLTCIIGNKSERIKKIESISQYDVAITSYDYLRRDIDLYDGISFEYIILDEAQYIKNQNTLNAQCVKALVGNHRLALSGTPIENSLAELWSIFDFIIPGYLYGYKQFSKQFERDIVVRKDQQKIAKLQSLVSPFILRRTKKEVLSELPDKVEVNLKIDFEKNEEKLYVGMLSKVNQELADYFDSGETNKMLILAMMTRLRQLCCEPRVIYENYHGVFSKLKKAMELCHSLKENGQKVLLFSSFTSILDLIAIELKKEGFSYLKLTGSNSKEERREMVQTFQEGNVDVFLISLKAGGTGLNLTAASAVIHYDPWWNVSAQNQASDRAYRIGQLSKVTVYRLVMANSIEEKIVEMQQQKADLANLFVEGQEFSLSSMSKEDILHLFER